MLFASQKAATANARAHRDERRTRADLEALVETSAVVVVLDARTGHPVSFNHEVRRIVEGLRAPDRSSAGAGGHEAGSVRPRGLFRHDA